MGKCKSCGGDSSDVQHGDVSVRCKCGSDTKIPVISIDKNRGTRVVHYTFGPIKNEEELLKADPLSLLAGIKDSMVLCQYATQVPASVWCPTCGKYLVKDWMSLIEYEDRHKLSKLMEENLR